MTDEVLSKALDDLAKKIEFEQAQENDREVNRLMFRYIFLAEGWIEPKPDPIEVTYG